MNKFILIFLLITNFSFGANFSQGIKYFNKKNYNRAIDFFQEIVKKNPENSNAYYYLGVSFYNIKSFKESEENLRRFFAMIDGVKDMNKIRTALSLIRNIYYRNKKWEEAIQIYFDVYEKIKNRRGAGNIVKFLENIIADAYYNLGNQYFWKRDFKNAEKFILEARKFNPKSTKIREKTGEILLKNGKFIDSVEEFLYVLENEKNNWYLVLNSSCFIVNSLSSYDEIKKRYENFTDLSKEIFNSCILLSNGNYSGFDILFKLEKMKKTEGDITFNILRKLFPEPTKETFPFYFEFIKRYPFSRRIEWTVNWFLKAFQRDREGCEQARNHLEKLIEEKIKENQENPEVVKLELLKINMEYSGKPETVEGLTEEIDKLKELNKKYPGSKYTPRILEKIASILRDKLQDYEEAIFYYEKLIEKPNLNFTLTLAECYEKTDRINRAKEVLLSYLEKRRNDIKAKVKLMNIYLENGEIDKGIKIYEEIKRKKLQENLKDEIGFVEENYRKYEGKIPEDGITFFEIVECEKFFTNYISLTKRSPLLTRKEYLVKTGFISEKEGVKEFNLIFISDNIPSLTEPMTVFKKVENKWVGQWIESVKLTRSHWYRVYPFRIIYNWREQTTDNLEIKRELREKGKKEEMKVSFFIPEAEWEIKIKIPYWARRNLKITPLPEETDRNFIFYYLKDKNFEITIEGNRFTIYPEINLRTRTETEEYKVSFPELKMDWGTLRIERIRTSFCNVKVFREKLYILEEKRIER